jgi:beta-N-acetylhexosaminidase
MSPDFDKLNRRQALAALMPGFVGLDLPEWLEARLRDGLGGVCIFGDNIESPAQLRRLTDRIRAANPDVLIAIDEEGGDVTRLAYAEGSPYQGNAVLGRIGDPALTERVGVTVGRQLRAVGCNLDFAPDADVNSNPDNPVIGVRSFGTDPALVAEHTVAWVRGLQSAGIAASVKHFPGHGDTAQDSHLALPVVDRTLAELRERELVPFVAAIAAGARTIMTSHIMLPQLDPDAPATLSRRILQGLLRDELGFDGVIVSDALDMHGASAETGIPTAAVRAIVAGCDLLCIGTDNTDAQLDDIVQAITAATTDGTLDPARLADAGARNVALARALPGPSDDDTFSVDFDLAATIAAFDVRPGIRPGAGATTVALETTANLAIGTAPWGPDGAVRLREGDALPAVSGTLVIVGRDNHRHGWVRAFIDDARASHPECIVVDMGWPGDGREYADVATFGASRHVSRALEVWLEGAQ